MKYQRMLLPCAVFLLLLAAASTRAEPNKIKVPQLSSLPPSSFLDLDFILNAGMDEDMTGGASAPS